MLTPVISLLTDFGLSDHYVGVMKGVMLEILPEAVLADITHLVSPQDVREGAYALMNSVPFFPDHTVHLVVVDPGVGSRRRAVGVETPRGKFIAPDNGVLSYVLGQGDPFRAVELSNPAYHLGEVSTTFHGRDIFSPAAAHLAAGVPLEEFGPEIDDLVWLPLPGLEIHPDRIVGEVIGVDHFGNLGTSINALRWGSRDELVLDPVWGEKHEPVEFSASSVEVEIGDLNLKGIARTFSAVEPGEALALVGSEHALDLSINQGNLAKVLDASPGDRVTLYL
jgi:hypothetical protein